MAENTNYTPIHHFRSTTPGAVPQSTDIAEGELGINLADRIIYSKIGADVIPVAFGINSEEWTVGGDDDFVTWLTQFVTDLVSNLIQEGNFDSDILAAVRPDVVENGTTSYTVSATNETDLIFFTSSSAISVTIPDDNTIIPVGFIVHLHQGGSGAITVAGASGVTVTSSVGLTSGGQGAALSLFKTGANRWTLVGDQA